MLLQLPTTGRVRTYKEMQIPKCWKHRQYKEENKRQTYDKPPHLYKFNAPKAFYTSPTSIYPPFPSTPTKHF